MARTAVKAVWYDFANVLGKQSWLIMISINDFQILPFSKQCDFITVFADYLIYRIELDKKYYLYNMGEFFVEVCYAPYEGRVENINAFTDTNSLEPYLEEVSISVLSV